MSVHVQIKNCSKRKMNYYCITNYITLLLWIRQKVIKLLKKIIYYRLTKNLKVKF